MTDPAQSTMHSFSDEEAAAIREHTVSIFKAIHQLNEEVEADPERSDLHRCKGPALKHRSAATFYQGLMNHILEQIADTSVNTRVIGDEAEGYADFTLGLYNKHPEHSDGSQTGYRELLESTPVPSVEDFEKAVGQLDLNAYLSTMPSKENLKSIRKDVIEPFKPELFTADEVTTLRANALRLYTQSLDIQKRWSANDSWKEGELEALFATHYAMPHKVTEFYQDMISQAVRLKTTNDAANHRLWVRKEDHGDHPDRSHIRLISLSNNQDPHDKTMFDFPSVDDIKVALEEVHPVHYFGLHTPATIAHIKPLLLNPFETPRPDRTDRDVARA